MNLKEHYNLLYRESMYKIMSENYKTDNLIDSETDRRLGLTIVIRPSAAVKNNIQQFLDELKKNRTQSILLSKFGYSHHCYVYNILL
jgi:hypothetical protein